jgi:hypothetical protein
VTGNQSLKGIWDKILRYRVGQEVAILAEYIWGPNRVESIIFSTPAPPPPPPPSPPTTLVWFDAPLPPSEFNRFERAIRELEIKVNATKDPRRWRYLCWIEKLKKPDVDDRIITWCRICPTSGAIGAAYAVGPCDLTQCTPVNQTALERSILSVSDVEVANKSLRFITHMRSSIVVDFEMTAFQLENLRRTIDEMGRAVTKLDLWANGHLRRRSALGPEDRGYESWFHRRDR